MLHQPKKVGILVGGGPAPGINAVIGAATIRAVLSGYDVVGIQDGFKWIMNEDIAQDQFEYPVESEPVPRPFFPEVVP